DPDPVMTQLARRAEWGLAAAVLLSLLCYTLSYQRHRKLMVEGARAAGNRDRKWTGALLEAIVANPRQQAILVFMTKTLARSGQHRMVLMGYGGFGLAILISVLVGMHEAVSQPNRTAA